MAAAPVELSVVVPVYGCEGALPELRRRVAETCEALGLRHELILVDDCSPDRSWEVMEELAADHPEVGIFRMSRNFGQHPAIAAGLAESRGEHVVVMDCDLQDPPEVIAELYEVARQGADIVLARQREKQTTSRRRMAGWLYYRLLAASARSHIDPRQGTFSLVSRRVVEAVLAMRDVDRNYVFQLSWVGFPTRVVDFDRHERHSGKSSYTFTSLVAHAIAGIVFQTTVLLRWVIYGGFVLAAAGIVLALYIIGLKLTGGVTPGWAGLAVTTLTIGGAIILSTGVTGLYVGRIFEQVRARPLYLLQEARPALAAPGDQDERAARAQRHAAGDEPALQVQRGVEHPVH